MQMMLEYHKSCNIPATPDIPVHHAHINTNFSLVGLKSKNILIFVYSIFSKKQVFLKIGLIKIEIF